MCSDQENHKQRSSKTSVGPGRHAGGKMDADTAAPNKRVPLRSAKASSDVKTKSTKEEETYRVRDG